MKLHRRQFLHKSTRVAAGALLLPSWACTGSGSSGKDQDAGTEPEAGNTALKLEGFGLQLYTLRDVIADDPKGILEQVGAMGYTQIESYEGPMGMTWGMAPSEFKSYCSDHGMQVVSSHVDIFEDFEKKAGQAAEIGMSYLICPWGKKETLDEYKQLIDRFNECGAICKENGIRFAYHNHGYSFEEMEGQRPHDLMMEQTDAELVDFEMDIYWVVTAGADPVEWLEKYPGRWKLSHVKDRMKGAGPEEHEASCDLGTGSIDFPTILAAAQAQGMKYFILEQERYDNSTPLKSAEAGANYLKQFV